jgi:hypothetical protein
MSLRALAKQSGNVVASSEIATAFGLAMTSAAMKELCEGQ